MFRASGAPAREIRDICCQRGVADSNHNPHAAAGVDKARGSFFRTVGTCASSREENINRDEANSTKRLWRDGELHERKDASFSRGRTGR